MGKKSKLKAQRREEKLRALRYTKEVADIQSQRRYADKLRLENWFLFSENPVVVDCQSIYDYMVDDGGKADEWAGGIYSRFPVGDGDVYAWVEYFKGTALTPPYRRMFLELMVEGKQFGAFLSMDADDDFSFVIYTDEEVMSHDDLRGCEVGGAHFYLTGQGELVSFDNDFAEGSYEHECVVVAIVCLKTLQFLNCRNIELFDREPDAELSRLHEKHYGRPMLKYKVLSVKPVGKRSAGTGPKEYQDIMPLHLRRGHFRHVENHPIAHLNGTHWINATTVGSEKNGIIVKDYKVNPQ